MQEPNPTTAWVPPGAMNQSMNSTQDSTHITTQGSLSGAPNQSLYTTYPPNCSVVDITKYALPWNHQGNLISWETEEIIHRVHSGVLMFFFLLGAPGNMVNMLVFYKQGLGDRMNVCLFCLALVDVLYLAPVSVFNFEQMYIAFTTGERYGQIFNFVVNNHMMVFYGFRFGSMLLSAIIAAERCVCVLFPLRAKHCIPTRGFAWIVVFATFGVSLLRAVIVRQYQMICVYELPIHRKSWQITFNAYFHQNRAMLRALDGVFYGLILSVGCPVVVLLATVITAVKLRQIVRWRSSTSSAMSSSKEIGLTKMLICLSVEFLVLSFPVLALRVTRLFPSVLDPYYHSNMFRVFEHGSNLSVFLSGSLNTVVYYATGTRFRETLRALLGIRGDAHKSVDGSSAQQAAATAATLSHNQQAP